MKTAVSIPDDLFAKAEELAAARQMSRSALYATALRELLKRVEDAAVTEQINAALKETGPTTMDPGRFRALRDEFDRNEGQW